MTKYWPGQRIKLITASLPGMQPGDLGTVRRHDPNRRLIAVDFDNGIYRTLTLPLDRSHRLEALPTTDEAVRAWGQTLVIVYTTGQQAGSNAADRWAQDNFTSRTAADTASQAQTVLDGIADGELTVLDTLPVMPQVGDPISPDMIAACNSGPSGWRTLGARQRAQAHQMYCDGFEAGLLDRTVERCLALLEKPGDGHDATAPPPDAPAHGVGVFAPHWARLAGDPSRSRIGFAGIMHYRTDSWLAFWCTRAVAEALAAELHRHHHRADETPDPAEPDDTAAHTVGDDADATVIDEDELLGHPHAVHGFATDLEPEYQVRVPAQHWQLVASDRCEHLVGDLLERQQATAGTWSGPALRVPHRRLQMVRQEPASSAPNSSFTVALVWDGNPVGAVRRWPHGGIDVWLSDPTTFEPKLHRYLDGCRVGGRPLTWARVLRALSDGPLLADAIERAYDSGMTLLRLVDPDGLTLRHQSFSLDPRDHQRVRQLSTAVADGQWQIWTGRRWRPIPAPIRPS